MLDPPVRMEKLKIVKGMKKTFSKLEAAQTFQKALWLLEDGDDLLYVISNGWERIRALVRFLKYYETFCSVSKM